MAGLNACGLQSKLLITCVLLGDNPASFPYFRARARMVSRMNGTDIRMSCSPQPLIVIPC